MQTILLIDPDYCARAIMRYHLRQAGFAVHDLPQIASLEMGLSAYAPHLVIIDEDAKQYNGQLIRSIMQGQAQAMPWLILTHLPPPPLQTWMRCFYLTKPVMRLRLLTAVAQMLDHVYVGMNMPTVS